MKRIVGFGNLLGFVSISVFLVTEIVVTAGAAIWSLSGLLGLGDAGIWVLGAILAVPSLYAIGMVVLLAWEAQTNPEHDPKAAPDPA